MLCCPSVPSPLSPPLSPPYSLAQVSPASMSLYPLWPPEQLPSSPSFPICLPSPTLCRLHQPSSAHQYQKSTTSLLAAPVFCFTCFCSLAVFPHFIVFRCTRYHGKTLIATLLFRLQPDQLQAVTNWFIICPGQLLIYSRHQLLRQHLWPYLASIRRLSSPYSFAGSLTTSSSTWKATAAFQSLRPPCDRNWNRSS